jgi:hypothetical protein
MKEAQLASKLDVIALEYNHLLTSQLESQRHYYEGLLAQQEDQAAARLAEALQAGAKAEVAAREAQRQGKEAERKRAAAEKKLVGRLRWSPAVQVLCSGWGGGKVLRIWGRLCTGISRQRGPAVVPYCGKAWLGT